MEPTNHSKKKPTHLHTLVVWKERSPNYATHKTKRVYRCTDKSCTAFFTWEFIQGKELLCNACGQPFVLTRDLALPVKPVCYNCSTSKVAVQKRAAADLMDHLLANQLSTLDVSDGG